MQKFSWRDGPRVPSIVLFSLVAFSFAVGMLTIFLTLRVEAHERAQVTLTNTVLGALRDNSRAIVDAETGQRGYLLTQEAAYLAPYKRGRREWPAAQAKLERTLDGIATDEQATLIKRLRTLGTSKLEELEEAIALVNAGRLESAQELVKTDVGRSTMVEYRETVQRLEMIEMDVLNDARSRADRYESRIVPILLVLAVIMIGALALGIWQMRRIAEAEAIAASAELVAKQRDRADLVSRELNHRVKNLFAVIQAIVHMSMRTETDVKAAGTKIKERIQALSTAHSVTQGHLEKPIAEFREIVDTAIAPYADLERQAHMEGPDIMIKADQVTPLGLILHELVTNCVKYGAWSERAGSLAVSWSVEEGEQRMLTLNWVESIPGGVKEPLSEGFGTRMITASARQLSGSMKRRFDKNGMAVQLTYPIG